MPPKAKKAYQAPKDLKSFRTAQEKRYGTRLVPQRAPVQLDFIPTGVSSLDVALGGGWARGRYHQIIGQPNSCKTAMMIIAIRNALETYPDLGASYIDVENTVTPERFLAHGVDPDDPRFFWRKPDSAEEVADMIREDLRTGLFSAVALDSLGAMEREDALYEKTASEVVMGKAAQLLTRMAKQVATITRQTSTAFLQVNQYRKNFDGGMDQPAGPMIMGYMTTDSVVMRRMFGAENTLTVKEDGEDIEVAHKVTAKVERSKIVAQGKKAEFWYHKVDSEHGEVGIDAAAEVYDIGTKTGAIEPGNGSWWNLPDGTKHNGRTATTKYLREHPEVMEDVRAKALKLTAEGLVPEEEVSFTREGE